MSESKTPLPFGLSIRTRRVRRRRSLAAFFSGTLWALNRFFPGNPLDESRPATAALTPLQPVTRTSVIVAPVAVAALAIRDAMEAHAPRDLTGKNENPLADLLGKADIGWTISRGPFAVSGASDRTEHLDHAQRLAPRHRPARQPGRQSHRRARRPARRQARRRSAEADHARARPARRHPRQRHGDFAARAAAELADRAEPQRPCRARRRRRAPSPASSSTSRTRSSRCSTRR